MKKYELEYNQSSTKVEFVTLLFKKYRGIRKKTAERRWYEFKSLKKSKVKLEFENNELDKPDRIKMLLFDDIKRYKIKITISYLARYGFEQREINWLIKNGEIIEDDTKWKGNY
jgi:hypothetical protein